MAAGTLLINWLRNIETPTSFTHFELAGWSVVLLLVGGVVFFLFSRSRMRSRAVSMESQFFDNLHAKEMQERKSKPVTSSIRAKMGGYDVHLEQIKVSADSTLVGRQLKEIPFRAETGANIIKITRGSRSILIPAGDEFIYPGDTLLAVGTKDQLAALKKMMADTVVDAEAAEEPAFDVRSDAFYVTYADTEPLERDFGFRPATPLQEGLRRFAEWYKEFYSV